MNIFKRSLIVGIVAAIILLPSVVLAQDSPELDATFTNTQPYVPDGQGLASFNYPSVWNIINEGRSTVTFGLGTETVHTTVVFYPSTSYYFYTFDRGFVQAMGEDMTLEAYADILRTRMGIKYQIRPLDTVSLTINTYAAIEVSYSIGENQNGALYVVDDGLGEPFVVVANSPAERETTLALAATVERDFNGRPVDAKPYVFLSEVDLAAAPVLSPNRTLSAELTEDVAGLPYIIWASEGDVVYVTILANHSGFPLKMVLLGEDGEVLGDARGYSRWSGSGDDQISQTRLEAAFVAPADGAYTMIIYEEQDGNVRFDVGDIEHVYDIRYGVSRAIQADVLMTGTHVGNALTYVIDLDSAATLDANVWIAADNPFHYELNVIRLGDDIVVGAGSSLEGAGGPTSWGGMSSTTDSYVMSSTYDMRAGRYLVVFTVEPKSDASEPVERVTMPYAFIFQTQGE